MNHISSHSLVLNLVLFNAAYVFLWMTPLTNSLSIWYIFLALSLATFAKLMLNSSIRKVEVNYIWFSLLIIGLSNLFRGDDVLLDSTRVKTFLSEPNEFLSLFILGIITFAPPFTGEEFSQLKRFLHKYRWYLLMAGFSVIFLGRNELGRAFEESAYHWLIFYVLLFLFYKVESKSSLLIITAFVLLYFIVVDWGRRGRTIYFLLMLSYPLVNWIQSFLIGRVKSVKKYNFAILIGITLLSLWSISNVEKVAFLARGLDSDAVEQSRGVIFINFFNDFGSESKDWLVGRGMLGLVKRGIAGVELETDIENGWLTLLLRFGLIFVIPFFLLLLKISLKGLRAKNFLIKLCGWNVFVYLIDLLSSDMLAFNPRNMLMVVSILAIRNKYLYYANDGDIHQILFK